MKALGKVLKVNEVRKSKSSSGNWAVFAEVAVEYRRGEIRTVEMTLPFFQKAQADAVKAGHEFSF